MYNFNENSRKILFRVIFFVGTLNMVMNTVSADEINGEALSTKEEIGQYLVNYENGKTISTHFLSRDVGTAEQKTMQKYRQWVFGAVMSINCTIYDTAKKGGFTAELYEKEKLLSEYRSAFPGISIDARMIVREIILFKYLQIAANYLPTNIQVQECYNEYLMESSAATPPTIEEMKTMLLHRALFMSDQVFVINEKAAEKQKREYSKSKEMWPIDEIRIDEAGATCLVESQNSKDCIVTVGEFNCFCRVDRMYKIINLQSARFTVLNKLLTAKYTAEKANKAGMNSFREIAEIQKKHLETKLLKNTLETQYNKETDKEVLRKIYDSYFDRFFSEKVTIRVGLIGATDSTFIDSIYRLLVRLEKDTSVNRPKKRSAAINSLPWILTSSEELPPQISSQIVGLKSQEYTKVATIFGYFICRVITHDKRPVTYFDDAFYKLCYLLEQEDVKKNGKPDSISAKEYYDQHKEEFVSPDTFACRIWLLPCLGKSQKNGLNDQAALVFPDTNKGKSIELSSLDLPADLVKNISARYKKNEDRLIGPIENQFGRWFCRINRCSRGHQSIPFKIVKDEIVSRIRIKEFPFDSINATEQGARMLNELVVTDAYTYYNQMKIDSLSDEDIKKLIKEKGLNVEYQNGNTADKKIIEAARHVIRMNHLRDGLKEVQGWINGLKIDSLINKGCVDVCNN